MHPQPVPERAPEQDAVLTHADARAFEAEPRWLERDWGDGGWTVEDRLAVEEPAEPAWTYPPAADPSHRARHARHARPADHAHRADRGPSTPASTPAVTPSALPQCGAQQVVTGAVVMTAAVVALDVALTDRLSMFFDLCFVLVGLWAALVVRRQGLYAVGVLPPLLLGAVVAFLALTMPSTLTASHLAFVSTWLTGLAQHGIALGATHLVVLAIVGLRAGEARGGRGR